MRDKPLEPQEVLESLRNAFKKVRKVKLQDIKTKSIEVKEKALRHKQELTLFLKNYYHVKKTLEAIYRSKEEKPSIVMPPKFDLMKTRLKVKIPHGHSYKEIENAIDKFETATGKRVLFTKDFGKEYYLYVYHHNLKEKYHYKDYFNLTDLEGMLLPFYVGISLNGELIIADFAKIYHALFCGDTGNGKTNFIRTLIVSLFLSGKPFMLNIIDYKGGGDYTFMDESMINLVSEPGEELALLRAIKKENERRNKLRKEKRVQDIGKLKPKDRPPFLVTIIDEIHALETKESQRIVYNLACTGRANGVFLIVCTQRPSANTYDGFTDLRAQLRGRVCMGTTSKETSQMVLNSPKATELKEVGRAIYQFLSKDTEVQTFLLDDDVAEKLIAGKELIRFEYGHHEERLLPRSKDNRVNRQEQGNDNRTNSTNVIDFRKGNSKKTKKPNRQKTDK